ncbi:hypothetical protein Patl1_04058 [Pistacia atlantica]|uniref:Uncharacterized protein n=1 Tax=Pistacia atlantica TaxID=434234 RepID=A0ACC1BWI5_9ROSI|nr:hypothetical protein Patl1_04058 [Pistacia atlantica]
MAPMVAASAAWNMGERDQMSEYASRLDDGDETKLRVLGNTAASGDGSGNGTFFRAVLLVRRGKYDEAREYVERARKCLATELASLVLESYERAYSNMVCVQQLSELEEVIDYCTLPGGNPVAEGRRGIIRNMGTEWIQGAKRNVEVWKALLAVRALVLPPTEDIDTRLKFASLCRKNGRASQARSTLVKLLQYDPETSPENVRYHGPPQVMLAYLKYQWALGDDLKRKEAFTRLQKLAMELSNSPHIQPVAATGLTSGTVTTVPFVARVYRRLGTWQWALSPGKIRAAFRNATQCAVKWGKAWHTWALFNTAVMSHYTMRGFPSFASQYVVAAVNGYFHSVACAAHATGVDDSLQDILRLLTLWFNHGATADVQIALQKGFAHVNINTWLLYRELVHRVRERELLQAVNQLGDANEVLNERAVVVMARMSHKLTGRDFSSCSPLHTSSMQHLVDPSTLISGDNHEVEHGLSVKLQVQKLICQGQAMSHENLCQNYVGYDFAILALYYSSFAETY